MDKTKRDFIKVATIAAAAGLVLKPSGKSMAMDLARRTPEGAVPTEKALTAGRWAMVVDTKKFTQASRNAVMEACRREHNIPVMKDSRHALTWIWDDEYEHVFPEQMNEHIPDKTRENKVLVLCNNCENPACVRVCPTKATFKRADGIVMMDYHRCIGCRFCMAACPYGSRSFNFLDPRKSLTEITSDYPTRTKGVVEKCNFCAERLARGQKPACVEACKGGEMIFGDLDDPKSEVRKVLAEKFNIRRRPELGTQPQVYYLT
ncbi:MAG: 4Fe-4S dicluster domain-containing protein [Deltaproteobacteria bacterium]|nr:4Fe-4S dicluster domain-containing protein [Deltaproteobacteria bacterium]